MTEAGGETLRALLLGDVCAEPGRRALKQAVPGLRKDLGLDFVAANCENAAAGYGVTPVIAEELFACGIDCLTSGDHIYDRKEIWEVLATDRRLLRPLNYPPQAPGKGWSLFDVGTTKVAVVSLVGRVFMKPVDCPFRRVLPVLEELSQRTPVVIVDFHAEATAEKQAMGWFLDGRVSAVLGTHTHVQTADERILPGGTGYATDVGMCGSFDSVLGMNKDSSLRRLIDAVPLRLRAGTADFRLNGVIVEIDRSDGRCRSIERLSHRVELPGIEPPPAEV
jgi:hypothetical protein